MKYDGTYDSNADFTSFYLFPCPLGASEAGLSPGSSVSGPGWSRRRPRSLALSIFTAEFGPTQATIHSSNTYFIYFISYIIDSLQHIHDIIYVIYAAPSHTPPVMVMVSPLWTCGGCGWVGSPPPVDLWWLWMRHTIYVTCDV